MRNNTSFYEKQHVVWWKTSRRFVRNNTSFYEKQHVVWWETTRCLMKNITSFCEKQHVVFAQKSLVRTTPKTDKSSHFFQRSISDQRTKFLIPLHFIDILHLTEKLWHLWQQKINIAVGRRALRVRAREFSLSAHLSLPLRLGENLVTLSFRTLLTDENGKIEIFEKILSLFRDFFTLSTILNPYIIGGRSGKGKKQRTQRKTRG